MEFKKDDGELIYGVTQSQKNMDTLLKEQKKNNNLIMSLVLVLMMFLFIFMYVVYRVESGNIIANIVDRCM